MIKVCILIGEGKSERYFFPSLIMNKYGFEAVSDKHRFLYKKEDIYWFFPFPPNQKIEPTGGKSRFDRKRIYRDADSILYSSSKMYFNDEYQTHYFILRDDDGITEESKNQKRTEYTKVFKEAAVNYESFEVVFPKKTIEAWYIGGLNRDFPYLNTRKNNKIDYLLKCKPEDLGNPKEDFNEVLSPDVQDQTIFVNDAIGEYLDIDTAFQRCLTFNNFIKMLESHNLI